MNTLLVDPVTGENLWTGNQGSTPIWTLIPGQDGPSFFNADNDNNGINDDQDLAFLQAVLAQTGVAAPLPLGQLNSACASYTNNYNNYDNFEISIPNVRITGTALGLAIPDRNYTVTTGSTLSVAGPLGINLDVDVPSLWGPDGLLNDVDENLDDIFIEIGSAYLTLGQPANVSYFQALTTQLTISVIENLVPTLLADLKAYTVTCSQISNIDETINITDPVSATIRIRIANTSICAAIQNFINNYECGPNFQCRADLFAPFVAPLATNTTLAAPFAANQSQLTGAPLGISVVPGSGGTLQVATQWQRRAEQSDPWNNVGGNQSTSYSVASTTPADSGFYRASVFNRANNLGTFSASTPRITVTDLLTVSETPPPVRNLLAGESTTLTVTGSGGKTPLLYQWQRNGVDIIGATTDTLTLSNVTSTAQATYRARVRDSRTAPGPQEVFSNNFTVTVLSLQQAPFDQTLKANEDDLILSVVPAGGDIGSCVLGAGCYTYAWFFTPAGGGPEVPLAETSNTLTISPATVGDAGVYRYTYADNSRSAGGSVTVQVVTEPIIIGTQPQNRGAQTGTNVTFTVAATGGVPADQLNFQWLFTPAAGGPEVVVGSGVVSTLTSSTLTINNAQPSNQGTYRARISDNDAVPQVVFSNSAILYVGGPLQIVPPNLAGGDFYTGASGSLTVNTSGGVGPLSYEWRLNGVAFEGAPNAPSFDLSPLTPLIAGSWTVAVTDTGVGTGDIANFTRTTVTSPSATIRVGGQLSIPPDGQPQSAIRATGNTVAFTVTTAGGLGTVNITWFKDGTVPQQVGTGSTLTLPGVTPANAGNYYAVAEDDLSQVTSNTVSLAVADVLSITDQPDSTTAQAGTTAVFVIRVTGGLTQTYNYDWRKNGVPIPGAKTTSGSSTSVLQVQDVATEDAGVYTVIISDGITDLTSAPATLTVTAGPANDTGLPVGGPLALAGLAAALAAAGAYRSRRR